MSWLFLGLAIMAEVTGTIALKIASAGSPRWYAVVALGYVGAFVPFTFALKAGMDLGVGYGVWAAIGMSTTALLSKVLFEEPLTRTMAAGIAIIVVGVLTVELGAAH